MFHIIKHPKFVKIPFQLFEFSLRFFIRSKQINPSRGYLASGNEDLRAENFVFDLYDGDLRAVSHLFPFPDVFNDAQENELKAHLNSLQEYFEKNRHKKSKWDENEQFDKDDFDNFTKLKLFVQSLPKDIGGLDLNKTQKTRIYSLLGKYELSVAIMLLGHQSLALQAVHLYGSNKQKDTLFKAVMNDNKIFAFAIYEEAAKADVAAMTTKAIPSADGKYYLISGRKKDVINVKIADIFIIFAMTQSPTTNKWEMTCFVYDKSYGGIEIHEEKKLGVRACEIGTVTFKDARIPKENIVGDIGMGHEIALMSMRRSRYSLTSALSGAMEKIVEKSVEFCSRRTQFGRYLYTFPAIEERLTRMAISQYVVESISYMLAGNLDQTNKIVAYSLESAMAKVFSSHAAWDVINNAMKLFGTKSYFRSLELEQLLRDIRIFIQYGQSNDLLRLYVSLNGLRHASLHMKEFQDAFKNPDIHLNLLSKGSSKQRVRSTSEFTPTLYHYVHPDLHRAARHTTDIILKFNTTLEHVLEGIGPPFLERQYHLIRLTDAATYCYAMLCCLSRCSRTLYNMLPTGPHEVNLTEIFCKKFAEKSHLILDNLEDSIERSPEKRLKIITKALMDSKGKAHSDILFFQRKI